MHDTLLEHSPWLGPESLVRYAEEMGLDLNRFNSDLETMRHQDMIDRDRELANSLGVYNSPSFYINGREVIGSRSYDYMKRIVEEELKNAEEKTSYCGFCHRPVPADGNPHSLGR